jgi:GNAT superfamily N-acetyltransferase
VEFTLRALEPTDGPALDALLKTQALSTAVAISTHYRYDVIASLLALHPNLYGVVATAPGIDGLAGMATAFIDEVQVEGRLFPCAHLENLKVHHDVRRMGLGRRLVEWRIAEARRRFGGPGVIATGVEATNVGSLATARKWAPQTLGPLKILIATTTRRAPALGDLTVRPIEDTDIDAVVEASNAFHADTNLYTRMTAEKLRAWIAPMDPGGSGRQYHVALTPGGSVVAGALIMQRYELMTDQIERLPTPLAALNKVVHLVPQDGVIRTLEVCLPWFAPGQLAAGRRLWEQIRYEWRGRATNIGAVVDPRSEAAAMCRVSRLTPGPRLKLMVPVESPVPLSESKPLSVWR